ncbi:MAG: transposase family protein [Thermoflexaceae bacterium]|nr:transposase family protein [Thermoflexaceae bacterium]
MGSASTRLRRKHGAGRKRHGRKRGHDFVHVAVDDHSRYAYAEALPDEKGDTTAGFLARAVLAFASVGITIHQRVLTDNGGTTVPSPSRQAASGVRHRPPLYPLIVQTNGKAEAFQQTLQRGVAYRCPMAASQEQLAALQPFL